MRIYLDRLPFLGILLYLVLYFYAASLYPGGTKFDPSTKGYSHIDNYWCDLTDSVTYSHRPNPARTYALVGSVLLPISLMPFWYFVAALFTGAPWKGWIARTFGCLAMTLAALLPLAHDALINAASFFGFIAFAVTIGSLIQARRFSLAGIALIATAFCLTNFLIWKTATRLDLLPIIQRLAFVSFFMWILLANRQILERKSEI